MRMIVIIYVIVGVIAFIMGLLSYSRTTEKCVEYKKYREAQNRLWFGLDKENLLSSLSSPKVISDTLWRYDFGQYNGLLTSKDMSLFIYFENDRVVKQSYISC